MEEKRRDISCKQQKAGNQRREDVRAITGADRKKRRQRLSGLLQADAEKGKLKEEHISREERTRRRESDSERKKNLNHQSSHLHHCSFSARTAAAAACLTDCSASALCSSMPDLVPEDSSSLSLLSPVSVFVWLVSDSVVSSSLANMMRQTPAPRKVQNFTRLPFSLWLLLLSSISSSSLSCFYLTGAAMVIKFFFF